MPLLDHFHPPLCDTRHWTGIHSAWATTITQSLNGDLLPSGYYAVPHVQLGQVEVDVATLQQNELATPSEGPDTATAVWAPAKPTATVPVDFTEVDEHEVHIFQEYGGPQLRAAIELVSPSNKDRPANRQAFARKCAAYLQQHVSLVIVDVVTERSANLHAVLIEQLGVELDAGTSDLLYSTAYRYPAGSGRLQVWCETLAVGNVLSTLPLWLDEDTAVPLDLEESYLSACRSLRIEL